jgi:LmbE family N-acetylglucosaminyl deacetylase
MPSLMICYAHPDDESFAGAGLAMKCHGAGIQTVLVTATHGQRGKTGDPPVCRPEELAAYRERELREAVRIIGFSALHLLGYEDRQLDQAPPDRIRHSLVSLIRQHRPVVVLTFDPNGFNAHPDHVAMGRFTMDAVSAAADPRWAPDAGAPHSVRRVLWTPPTPPWEAGNVASLAAEPGVDFLIDISTWKERKAAALRAHKTQHLSIDRYFFGQPDPDRLLSVEIYRHGWGPPLTQRPSGDVFEGIDLEAAIDRS